MVDDPYVILGVSRVVSFEELRTAFRARARALHPDLRPDDPTAGDQFRRLKDAYQLLRLEVRARPAPKKVPDPIDRVVNRKRSEARYAPTPFSSRPREGSSVSGVVTLPFVASIKGGEHVLRIEDASGSRRRRVTLAPGMEDGQLFRLEGRVVRSKVEPDQYLTRLGPDVLLSVPVSVSELVLGAVLQVPTVDGPAELTIPSGTAPGQRMRLRGKGVGGVGDQLCALELVLPKGSAVEEAVRALAEVDPPPGRPWEK